VPGAVERAFGKLGDTEFQLAGVEVENPQALFAPASMLNELRRQAVEALADRLLAARGDRIAGLAPYAVFSDADPAERWSLMTDQPELLTDFRLEDWDGLDEVVLDVSRAEWAAVESAVASVPADRLRLALPVVVRQAEEAELRRRIGLLRDRGFRAWQIANLAGLTYLAPHEELDLLADWPLYVLNTPAMACLDGLGLAGWTLSPEDGGRNLADLLGAAGMRSSVAVYQDTPLAVSATCLFASANGFCPGRERCTATEQEWTTRSGDRLLAVNDHCRSVVLGDKSLSLSGRIDQLRQAGGRRFRVDFVWRRYDLEEAQRLWREIRADRPLAHTHTGNLDRELDHS
jgi:putative protease